MWLLITRAPLPDAPYWSGRRLLSLGDGVAWPAAWIVVAPQLPQPSGIVGPMVIALAALSLLGRAHCAVMQNHRYHFTTWRWGQVAAMLLLMGLVMKVALTA
jgi:hypothetical protein